MRELAKPSYDCTDALDANVSNDWTLPTLFCYTTRLSGTQSHAIFEVRARCSPDMKVAAISLETDSLPMCEP